MPEEPDSDWPSSMEVVGEKILEGNPLDDGDDVYNLRGSYRYFLGHLGLDTSIGYAEPTSGFVQGLGGDAELLFLDLSLVWYVNYNRYYDAAMKRRASGRDWHGEKRIKPEFIIFGGPGWASLRIKDAFPNAPLPDASRDFLTFNAGVGVKLYRMRNDEYKGWDHRTSRWYIRPEIRGRWIDERVDWGVSIAVGYGFGKRPSYRALELTVHETCDEASDYAAETPGNKRMTVQEEVEARGDAMKIRERLEELKARTVACGHKCDHLREKLDSTLVDLNGMMEGL